MKTIVVGDIHGHVISVEMALAMPYNVVFLGDYLDSFSQSVEDQVRCLTMVMDAIDAEPDRVVGLFGNHEMSYLVESMQCSGWKQETATHVTHLKERMLNTLKDYYWVGGVLVSHAGVDQELLYQLGIGLEEYLEAAEFNQIGSARGGYAAVGGLYWNDFNMEMKPVDGLPQVVGHTNWRQQGDDEGVRVKRVWEPIDGDPSIISEVWCVDNLNRKAEVLMIDDAGCQPFPLGIDEGGDDGQDKPSQALPNNE